LAGTAALCGGRGRGRCWFASFQSAAANHVATKSERRAQNSIRGILIAILTFLIVLFVGVVLAVLGVVGMQTAEQRNLFQPTPLDKYRELSGTIYTLPSGGLVLNTTAGTSNSKARRVLFCMATQGTSSCIERPWKRSPRMVMMYGRSSIAVMARPRCRAASCQTAKPCCKTRSRRGD